MPFCTMRLTALKPTPYPREPRTIGDHLKKRRCELGLRQIDAGKQVGVTTDTIHNWETNACPPSIRFMPRIIAFLGYDPFPPPQSLGEQIVARRRRLGWSRKRLAKRLGVDGATLAKWEMRLGIVAEAPEGGGEGLAAIARKETGRQLYVLRVRQRKRGHSGMEEGEAHVEVARSLGKAQRMGNI